MMGVNGRENAVNRISLLRFGIVSVFTFVIGVDGNVTNACGHVGIYPAAGKEGGSLPSALIAQIPPSSGAGNRVDEQLRSSSDQHFVQDRYACVHCLGHRRRHD